MEHFKKNLLKVCKQSILGPILCLVVALLFLLAAISETGAEYEAFNPYGDGYAKMDVMYVMGPFAEQTTDGKASDEYYIAEDAQGYWYVISTGATTSLPVYGVDITDEDIPNLTAQTVEGTSEYISSDLVPYLVDFLSDTGAGITEDNYEEYMGSYYLNTRKKAGDANMALYIMAAVFVAIAALIFFSTGKQNKAVKKKINEMEQSGQLATIGQDFAIGQPIYSKKTKLAVSDHYVIDFAVGKEGFTVVPLENVCNVFKCNMVDGNPTATSYLALERTDGRRYLAGTCVNKGSTADLYQIIARLKSKVTQSENGGAQW